MESERLASRISLRNCGREMRLDREDLSQRNRSKAFDNVSGHLTSVRGQHARQLTTVNRPPIVVASGTTRPLFVHVAAVPWRRVNFTGRVDSSDEHVRR